MCRALFEMAMLMRPLYLKLFLVLLFFLFEYDFWTLDYFHCCYWLLFDIGKKIPMTFSFELDYSIFWIEWNSNFNYFFLCFFQSLEFFGLSEIKYSDKIIDSKQNTNKKTTACVDNSNKKSVRWRLFND